VHVEMGSIWRRSRKVSHMVEDPLSYGGGPGATGIGLSSTFPSSSITSQAFGRRHISHTVVFGPSEDPLDVLIFRSSAVLFDLRASCGHCSLGLIHKSRTRNVGAGRKGLGGSHICDCCACDYTAMYVEVDEMEQEPK
jgi:hypothetical protein